MSHAVTLLTEAVQNQREKLLELERNDHHRELISAGREAEAALEAQKAHVQDLERSLKVLQDVELSVADDSASEFDDQDQGKYASALSYTDGLNHNVAAFADEIARPMFPGGVDAGRAARSSAPTLARDFGIRAARTRDFSDPIRLPLGEVVTLTESFIDQSKLTLTLTQTGVALLRAGYAVCITEGGDVYDARGIPPQPAPTVADLGKAISGAVRDLSGRVNAHAEREAAVTELMALVSTYGPTSAADWIRALSDYVKRGGTPELLRLLPRDVAREPLGSVELVEDGIQAGVIHLALEPRAMESFHKGEGIGFYSDGNVYVLPAG